MSKDKLDTLNEEFRNEFKVINLKYEGYIGEGNGQSFQNCPKRNC